MLIEQDDKLRKTGSKMGNWVPANITELLSLGLLMQGHQCYCGLSRSEQSFLLLAAYSTTSDEWSTAWGYTRLCMWSCQHAAWCHKCSKGGSASLLPPASAPAGVSVQQRRRASTGCPSLFTSVPAELSQELYHQEVAPVIGGPAQQV